ncbi:MAG TPA: PTS sugar transporter subunit IIA [Sumerlaeia bacterium]|nr:PTS sugar transporter subunit IIA [Sumerlaeia bacterium]
MKLAALFDENHILIHMESATFAEAVADLVESVRPLLGRLNPEKVRERLLEVEAEMAVAPGNGVRIPHARLGGLERLVLALGTSEQGIPAPPGIEGEDRIHLIFLILTPKTESAVMLQTMASIARLVSVEEHRKALVSTKSPARALRIFEESGIEVKKVIVAGDLMSPVTHVVAPDMTLRQVVAALVACGEEGLPVVDEGGDLLGDISTRAVIQIGLPKYMDLITNPAVLSDFQPFESFYRREDALTAREAMNRDVPRLPPETPVEIVAHEMLTKKCERAYVVRDKSLVGVVYRKDIVRKVLYL